MKMLCSLLVGAILVGGIFGEYVAPTLTLKMNLGPDANALVLAILVAFLGATWGWVARGIFGRKVTT